LAVTLQKQPFCHWGILVRLVICVIPGHWKHKIVNMKNYGNITGFSAAHIIHDEKKIMGKLIWLIGFMWWEFLKIWCPGMTKWKFGHPHGSKHTCFFSHVDCISSITMTQIKKIFFFAIFDLCPILTCPGITKHYGHLGFGHNMFYIFLFGTEIICPSYPLSDQISFFSKWFPKLDMSDKGNIMPTDCPLLATMDRQSSSAS